MGPWSPLGGTEWLRNPDWVLDEEHPELPVSVPAGRNNLPETVPYAYGGSDFTEPTAAVVVLRRRPARKPGTPPIDPGGPGVPFSAPAEWLAELAQEGL